MMIDIIYHGNFTNVFLSKLMEIKMTLIAIVLIPFLPQGKYPRTTTFTFAFLWNKSNVRTYEYHFLTKGIDQSGFLVVQVQVVLFGKKKMCQRNRFIVQQLCTQVNFAFILHLGFVHLHLRFAKANKAAITNIFISRHPTDSKISSRFESETR